MRDEILNAAAKKRLFLSPEALEIIESNGYPMDFINTLLNSLSKNEVFVTRKDVIDFLNGDKTLFESEKVIKPKTKRDLDLKIIESSNITGNSTCEGHITDFVQYFRSRYTILKRIIANRSDFNGYMSIDRALKLERETNIIGMVYDKKTTKNGNTMLILEDDEGGTCSVIIGKDSPLKDEIFVTDEVIGVTVSPIGKDFLRADKIFRPDIPSNRRWQANDSISSIAFLSDIHVGSKEFLQSEWDRMIRYLKDHAYEEEINYLVLPGDVVDGIGAYPDQEKDLAIMDIYDQYKTLAEYLKEIPDHMKIVIHPGNHDACRLAEPQPALKEVFTKDFDSNIYMVGNPINIEVEGRLVTSYHGKSIDDWIAGVRGMSYDEPIRVMKEMAMRRHLAPMYGQRNALAPEKKDYLAMEMVPDIFVSGHVHGVGLMDYHGTKMINASTWQSQTDYQKMHNFNPIPAVMPTVHLGSGHVALNSFMKD